MVQEPALNLSMLSDFYEFTMANGYFKSEMRDRIVYFDLFFRSVPDGGGFAIFAGVAQVIDYLTNLRFTDEDLAYFRSKGLFDEEFIGYLRDFEFTCDVYAIEEGTPVFPNEPLLILKGPAIQAQLVETVLLVTLNHQSLIATKANRIVRAAEGRPVLEFGARRAHGAGAALYGSRAAFIGGCSSTSNTLAGRVFDIPAAGTMAHSWVQIFDSEYDAFATYARLYPDDCTLLIDTYNVLKSGLPNAIRVFDEVLSPLGFRPKGVRIDSGDMTYLSIRIREMLDEAGYQDCKIVASNSLDEYLIRDTLSQGARIDIFGVGERLVTAESHPVFGGVYKLVAVEKDGGIQPKIKISENISKITLPHFKHVYRLFSKETGRAIADYITLHDEVVDCSAPLELFHPEHTWKRKTVENFTAVPLLVKMVENGKCIYAKKTTKQIQDECTMKVSQLWDEVKRFEYPHEYIVDLSPKLWETRYELLLLQSSGSENKKKFDKF